MCIVSFYKINDQVLLTHSRDENVNRPSSSEVEERFWNDKPYAAPVDQEKQGTWIFHSEEYIACILNGGKTKPEQLKPTYRKSRGIVLLDLLKYDSVEEYVQQEDFNGIAPFTIFVYERKSNKIFLLFWDEKDLEINNLSHQDFVFRCSSTLYSFNKMIELEKKFPTFNTISINEIYQLHDSIKMNDGDVEEGKATTSITQVLADTHSINMKYCPLK